MSEGSEEAFLGATRGGRNPLWAARTVVLSLVLLSLVLVVAPLTLSSPGQPHGLKADESAYFLMALSLGRDGDLRYEAKDAERLFDAFPHRMVRNLILTSDDGWQTLYYGKPYLYSLFVAPAAVLFGANGMLAANAALLLLAIWSGALFLARRIDPAYAALFAVGFYLLSPAFSYVFWLHPEVFTLAAVATSLYAGYGRVFRTHRGAVVGLSLSGGLLAVAAYGKPMYAALGLALVGPLLLERRFRHVAVWLIGFVVVLGLAAVGSWRLIGHPSSYMGGARQGVTVCAPDEPPPEVVWGRAAERERVEAMAARGSDVLSPAAKGGSWGWIFRVPPVTAGLIAENLGYFLWGRHAGLLPYFPFAGLALLLFLLRGPRSRSGWLLLISLGIVALWLVVFIDWNWQGGGGFVGNRYYVSVVPGFLFLLPSIGVPGLVAGFLAGSLLMGGLVLTPLGTVAPQNTLQVHTRNAPLRWLPYEHSLRNVPGYVTMSAGALRIKGRQDRVLQRGDALWLHGGTTTELFITTRQPQTSMVFDVSSPVLPNLIEMTVGGQKRQVTLTEDSPVARLDFQPEPTKKRHQGGEDSWIYHGAVEVERGRPSLLVRHYPQPLCRNWAYNAEENDHFWHGASLQYLGTSEEVASDVFGARWSAVEAPDRVVTGERFEVRARLKNISAESWTVPLVDRRAATVLLSYHWVDESGAVVVKDGLRSPLPGPVEPGSEVAVVLEVEAPPEAGLLHLELEPVYELIAWFSAHDPASVDIVPIEVVASEPPK